MPRNETAIHITTMPSDPQIQDPTAAEDPSDDVIFSLEPLSALPLLPPIQPVDALLANNSLTLPDELVHGLLHRGTKGVLAGSSKAGKTWVLLDLAISVATGSPFLQWSTSPGRVLFINLEIQEAFFRQRFQTLLQSKGMRAVPNLDVLTLRGYESDGDELINALEERARESNYSLIVIDPIYKLMVGRCENGATGVGKLCQTIERFVVRTGAAVIYAHHFSKGNQASKKAMDRMSGSGVFARDPDTIITLTEHGVEGCFVVESTLRNMPSTQPFVIEWDFPVMRVRNELDPENLQRGQQSNGYETPHFILSLLGDQNLATAEWQALAQQSGVPRATFFRARRRLQDSGAVVEQPGSRTWVRRDQAVSRETGGTPGTPQRPAGVSDPLDDPPRRIYIPPDGPPSIPSQPPPGAASPAPPPVPSA